jgi:hypothetical protein
MATIGATTVALILANPGAKSSQLLGLLNEATPGGTTNTIDWYKVHVRKAQNGLPCKLTKECLALVGSGTQVARTGASPRTQAPAAQAHGLVKGGAPRYTLEEAAEIIEERARIYRPFN